jgi:hypothetical protein
MLQLTIRQQSTIEWQAGRKANRPRPVKMVVNLFKIFLEDFLLQVSFALFQY